MKLVGWILVFGSLMGAILLGSTFLVFIDFPSMLLILGVSSGVVLSRHSLPSIRIGIRAIAHRPTDVGSSRPRLRCLARHAAEYWGQLQLGFDWHRSNLTKYGGSIGDWASHGCSLIDCILRGGFIRADHRADALSSQRREQWWVVSTLGSKRPCRGAREWHYVNGRRVGHVYLKRTKKTPARSHNRARGL